MVAHFTLLFHQFSSLEARTISLPFYHYNCPKLRENLHMIKFNNVYIIGNEARIFIKKIWHVRQIIRSYIS
jgi:hypothetical protein